MGVEGSLEWCTTDYTCGRVYGQYNRLMAEDQATRGTSKNSAASSASTFSAVKAVLQECQKLSRACSYCQ